MLHCAEVKVVYRLNPALHKQLYQVRRRIDGKHQDEAKSGAARSALALHSPVASRYCIPVQVTAPEGLLPARQVELHLFFDALLEPQKSDIYQSVWRVVRLHTPKVCVRHFA